MFCRAWSTGFAVGAARRGNRIDHVLDAQRTGVEQRDLAGLDVAALADAAAIDGLDVLHAGRQPRALHAVAERDRDLVVVVRARDEVAILGTQRRHRAGLVPLHVVDADLQRACDAGHRRRRHEGQRRLFEVEGLQRLARVARAQRLLARLAMGGVDHVAVDRHRLAPVGVGEAGGEGDEAVSRLAGRAAGRFGAGPLRHAGDHHEFGACDAGDAGDTLDGVNRRPAGLSAVRLSKGGAASTALTAPTSQRSPVTISQRPACKAVIEPIELDFAAADAIGDWHSAMFEFFACR